MTGLVTFFFCRTQNTIDKFAAKSRLEYPDSYPEEWNQPSGVDWVNAHKIRQIKRKFQVMHGNDPRKIFRIIDVNGDGSVTRLELAASLRNINVWLHPNETTVLMAALDNKDKNDCIDEAEFVLWWTRTI